MARIWVAALLAAGCLYSAPNPKEYNGRWDITVNDHERKRAWWLEVQGAETGSPTGSFIGAPGGGLDQIKNMKLDNGELTWSFEKKSRDGKIWLGKYRAKLVNGKLQGATEVKDSADEWVWTGVPAPKFKTADVSQLKEGQPIALFNGKDISGWRPLRDNVPMKWHVEDGVLKNAPGTTDIVTEDKFQDFKLHAEYRVGPNSNSGIGLRGRYEVQILQDYGRPVSLHGNGALYSRILPTKNASKPANEWQTYDITLVGNYVTVVLNGEKIIDNKEIEGLTAIAMDPNEGQPGPIVIQGDHGSVEFRKITLTPLVSK
jgi:hypothetical protein